MWTVVNFNQLPTPRESVWRDKDVVAAIHPVLLRVLDRMLTTGGAFPHPYNLRFAELQDTWANTSDALFYGEVPFEQGLQSVQKQCQAIVELERP